ncbi:MAG: glutamate racemase [Bacteroidota bacterium]
MLKRQFFILLFSWIGLFGTAQQKTLPIGVFDSGTGGLTVLEAILNLDAFNNETGAPGADGKPDFTGEYFQYLADQANMPYGNYAGEKKTKLLQEHVIKNMDFLLQSKYEIAKGNQMMPARKQGVKMLVLACNTATAFALNEVKEHVAQSGYTTPTIGVINAGVKAALEFQVDHPGTIGIFATAGTVASNGYPRTILEMAKTKGLPQPIVVSQGGHGLADAIDRDYSFFDDQAKGYRKEYRGPSVFNASWRIDTALMLQYNFNKNANKLLCEFDDKGNCLDIQLNDPENYVRYHLVSLLEKMKAEQVATPMNTLILGCTHYPFMRDTIRNVLKELYNFKQGDHYRYRSVLAPQVELIDPAVETAKEAYVALRALQLQNESAKQKNLFFITVPNASLNEVKLQSDGWFTYEYKYGRKEGEGKKYVNFVPFDDQNISSATYQRLKVALPLTYSEIFK